MPQQAHGNPEGWWFSSAFTLATGTFAATGIQSERLQGHCIRFYNPESFYRSYIWTPMHILLVDYNTQYLQRASFQDVVYDVINLRDLHVINAEFLMSQHNRGQNKRQFVQTASSNVRWRLPFTFYVHLFLLFGGVFSSLCSLSCYRLCYNHDAGVSFCDIFLSLVSLLFLLASVCSW